MSNDTVKKIDPITLAALRPEFRSTNFDPNDYELLDGLLVRKDRFQSICRNLAFQLYRGNWSCVSLKRHLSALSDWWGSFSTEFQEENPKPALFFYRDNECSVSSVDPISRYAIENGYYSFKKEGEVTPESQEFDLILKDGSLLAGCYLRHACLQKPGKINESTQLITPAAFFWRIQNHEINVQLSDILSIRAKTEKEIQAPSFLTVFTRENLADDNESQLNFEDTQKDTSQPPPLPFHVG